MMDEIYRKIVFGSLARYSPILFYTKELKSILGSHLNLGQTSQGFDLMWRFRCL